MEGQFHVDLEQLGERLHHLHQLLVINHLERFLYVRLHQVEKLSEALFELAA